MAEQIVNCINRHLAHFIFLCYNKFLDSISHNSISAPFSSSSCVCSMLITCPSLQTRLASLLSWSYTTISCSPLQQQQGRNTLSNKTNNNVQVTPRMCKTSIGGKYQGNQLYCVIMLILLNVQMPTGTITIVDTKQLIHVHFLLNLILISFSPPQKELFLVNVKFVT